MVEIMYKEAFLKSLSKKHRRPQQFYRDALTEILAGVQEQLRDGKTVQFLGFGTFYTRTRKAGKARNFKTNQPIQTHAVRISAFRPGMTLRRAVRGKPGTKKGISALLTKAVRRKK
jgi:DNA-binding protein HU-beta